MPEISADERLTAVMEVLEERGITTETLAEIFLFSALHLNGYLPPRLHPLHQTFLHGFNLQKHANPL